MPIPDYQTIMLPLLQLTADNNEHSLRESIEKLSKHFSLTDAELEELLPSGSQAIFDNRVGWAKTHILKAGLLESPRRSIFKITQRGKDILKQNPQTINVNFLKQFKEYTDFIRPTSSSEIPTNRNLEESRSTPEEILETAYLEIRRALSQELLQKIKASPPRFFERVVVELLVKMGYGGTLKDAGKTTQLTNDEGIDGIIKEDKLGLDVIYIQAKRWEENVGRPDIQSFVGALDGQRANKGVFITTSKFAETAKAYVKTISKKVILIDGEELANYMIDYGLGVSPVTTYELKRIDNDYFGE